MSIQWSFCIFILQNCYESRLNKAPCLRQHTLVLHLRLIICVESGTDGCKVQRWSSQSIRLCPKNPSNFRHDTLQIVQHQVFRLCIVFGSTSCEDVRTTCRGNQIATLFFYFLHCVKIFDMNPGPIARMDNENLSLYLNEKMSSLKGFVVAFRCGIYLLIRRYNKITTCKDGRCKDYMYAERYYYLWTYI